MAVIRIKKESNYTVIDNHCFRNRGLSLKAMGLLSLMMSLPDTWVYSLKGISKICDDGIASVRSGIKELEEHGYVVRRRIRETNGRLGDIEYTIYEKPQNVPPKDPDPAPSEPNTNLDKAPNPAFVQKAPLQEPPVCEIPTCENHTQAFHTLENCTLLNTKVINKKELSTNELNKHIPSPTAKGVCDKNSGDRIASENDNSVGGEVIDNTDILFDKFWELYPRKQSKHYAIKAWRKLNPDHEIFDKIVTAIEYRRQTKEWQNENGRYIPYPATWLKDRRWEDEIEPQRIDPSAAIREKYGDILIDGKPIDPVQLKQLEYIAQQINQQEYM